MSDTKRNWQEKTLDAGGDMWDKENPIEGKLAKIETQVGPNKSNLYTLELEDENEVKVWGSTVLDDKLLGVPVGTYVKIEYEGKLRSKKGTEYHSYKVFVDIDSMPQEEAKATKPAQKDVVIEDIGDEPIKLSDIPF